MNGIHPQLGFPEGSGDSPSGIKQVAEPGNREAREGMRAAPSWGRSVRAGKQVGRREEEPTEAQLQLCVSSAENCPLKWEPSLGNHLSVLLDK